VNKYGFKIKTRNGLMLDSLVVQADSRAEAERRITQIYHHCEIVECCEHGGGGKQQRADLDEVISLISSTPA
jgi:hypothetical protein